MDVQTVANKARVSISKYCIEECNAFCCRKGFLDITLKEADLIAHGKKDELIKSETFIKINETSFALDLSNSCPSLKDNMCIIHKNPNRPKVCKEFPVFVEGSSVRLSNGCPAVRNKLLYSFEAQFIKLGYNLTVGK